MNLKDIGSVTGMPGLYRLEGQRNNGLIVTHLESDKKSFISNRKHFFTPLENITLYTDGDGVELAEAFAEMKKQVAENPPVAVKASGADLRKYFKAIIPNHDEERLYTSDIKKILKWYDTLDGQGLVSTEVPAKEEPVAESEESNEA